MNYLPLASTGRKTTCLGFGCSVSDNKGAHLLDAAYDAGIRHFDVAPSYAHGLSEGYLGKFLTKKRDHKITVTTKYGILPPSRHILFSMLHKPLRPLLRKVRKIPSVDRRVGRSVAAMQAKARFSAEEADASLRHSMRALRVEYIDLFLMHEATVEDLGDEQLLRFLERCVSSGRIGAFGVGGEVAHLPPLMQQRSNYCQVLQFKWSILEPTIDCRDSFRIHFRTFAQSANRLRISLSAQPELCRQWCDYVGMDLMSEDVLAGLLLKAAFVAFPNAMILFSSKRPLHIYRNVLAMEDTSLEPKARLFTELLKTQPDLLPVG